MIEKIIEYDYDPTLAKLLESNDHVFSGGRSILKITEKDNKIILNIKSKDEAAHRAMLVSIKNTVKILEKAKSVI